MRWSLAIGRVWGIEIRIHFTFLLILPVLIVAFGRAFIGFQQAALMAGIPPELIRGGPWLWGTVVALALFASVLVHELAHSWMALRKGGKVRDITLLMIGGVANVAEPPKEPKQEALMAFVGPLVSILLAATLFLLYLVLAPTTLYSLRFALFYLSGMNLVLAAFNLLPAFPMDGGRVLRGILATRIGVIRATQFAALLGKGFAVFFALASFFTFNFFLLLIAFFVYLGAEAESSQVLAKSVLGEVRVADLLERAPEPIDASATVEEAAARMVRDRALALLVRQGDVLGVIALDDVERVPPEARMNLLVGALARPAPPVSPATNVWEAFRLMTEQGLPLVPVADERGLVGVLTQETVVRGLRLFELERNRRHLAAGQLAPRERHA